MQFMLASVLLTLGLGVAASPAASVDARDPPTAYCEWYGYTGTGFTGTKTRQSRTTVCNKITESRLIHDLLSAKVTAGGAICLYTGQGGCTGSRQTIDSAGYRNMRDLPAYYHYECGAC